MSERATTEGVQRGHFLVGPMSPGSPRRYLFCVTKVLGAHKIEALTNTGQMIAVVTMWTTNLNTEESEIRRATFRDMNLDGQVVLGEMVDTVMQNVADNEVRIKEEKKRRRREQEQEREARKAEAKKAMES